MTCVIAPVFLFFLHSLYKVLTALRFALLVGSDGNLKRGRFVYTTDMSSRIIPGTATTFTRVVYLLSRRFGIPLFLFRSMSFV